jgi:PKD repeat protein
MNMTSRFAVQTARNACLSLLAVATLAACGGGGGSGSSSTPVPPGSAPASTQSASISATPTADVTVGSAPMQLTFIATNPRGSITSFEWDFKDNSPVAMGQSVQHTFMAAGAYNVTLTVRDSSGNFNRAALMVTVQAGSTQCSAAPTEFTTKVWPSMSGTCTLCHTAGGVAGGTGLVLSTGTVLQNYNIIRDYALKNDSLLLSKTVGLPTHGGGAPFLNTSDQRYLDLAALVPIMKQSCASTPIDGPAMGQFWNGVTFASDQKVLARAAILFAGRNPTAAEESAVTAGGTPVLRQTIRDYMQGPAFQAFLDEVGETWFLTRGATIRGNNMGYNATDWPSAVNVINNTNLAANELNRFVTGSRVEPIELMKYIVNNERAWTEMVSGNYTVVNAIVAQYMQAQVNGTFANPADDTVFLPAVLPSQRLGGNREHAGVLSTQAWLSRFPTTPTNRNRHRVYQMAKQFRAPDRRRRHVPDPDDGEPGVRRVP